MMKAVGVMLTVASAHEPSEPSEVFEDALVRIDRCSSESADDARCADVVHQLITGRWSTVEQFERYGRRYYLVHQPEPEVGVEVLTPREREVLGFAELGQSNKLIAYSLGLSTSTVATLLVRARKKVSSVPPPIPPSEEPRK